MKEHSCSLFVNFQGIGNGVMTAPILRCYEASFPNAKYFYTDNPILKDYNFRETVQIRNLQGFVESQWRRFSRPDWEKISDFISQNNINLIINFRNEGPKYDQSYYEFKKWMSNQNNGVMFWDLDFKKIASRSVQTLLVEDIITTLKKHGVDFSGYNRHWLVKLRKKKEHDPIKKIGFGVAASQECKRWPIGKWVSLAKITSDCEILLFPGTSNIEQDEAKRIALQAGNKNCNIIANEGLWKITQTIANLDCFVSNDTGLLHIAVATGIPTIGIFTATDPYIWGYNEQDRFYSFINQSMFKCDARKTYSGNCMHYYSTCPAVKNNPDTIDPREVFNRVLMEVNRS